MATYKDDLDIIKAAEKDSSKLSLNAITELDNKGLLGMYGGGGSEEDLYPDFDGYLKFDRSAPAIEVTSATYHKLIAEKEPKDASVVGVFFRASDTIVFCEKRAFDSDFKEYMTPEMSGLGVGFIQWYSELELEDVGLSGILQPNTWYVRTSSK